MGDIYLRMLCAAQLASRTFRTDTVEKFKPKMACNGI